MKLNKLVPSQHKKGRWLVHLEDGTLLRVTEREVVSFGLYSGMELEGEVLAALTAAAQQSKVRDDALNLLTGRPHSRRELERKLTRKGAEAEDAADAGAWLEELGLLNDADYARQIVRHYSAKGFGRRKIQDELYRRGVPREFWDDAMVEREDPAEAIDAFLQKKLGRGPAPDRQTIKRVSDALARRGFSWSEISEGLRRYGAEVWED